MSLNIEVSVKEGQQIYVECKAWSEQIVADK